MTPARRGRANGTGGTRSGLGLLATGGSLIGTAIFKIGLLLAPFRRAR
ncbi:MAG TPA: hypothetical protein VHM01_09640 [Alphaproteobacteria bacterium]|nr:hypothetical protein [Alphaproteobacteria bacterium]